MKRMSGSIAMAAMAAMAASGAAEAKDRAEGWRAWVERARSIDLALQHTDAGPIKAACNGVTGTMISQGFEFPRWAQALPLTCQVSKDRWLYQGSRRGIKRWCGDIKAAANQLGKAEPVAEAPEAAPLALELSGSLRKAHEELC